MESTYTVAQLRAALRAAGGQGAPGENGTASSPLLGQIFHRCAAALGAADSPQCWATVLDSGRLSSGEAVTFLTDHFYTKLLGPQLERHRAALSEQGGEVLDLWSACRALCEWLIGVLQAAERENVLRFNGRWQGQEGLWRPDYELSYTFEGPGRRVVVRGEADALWFDATRKRWCVLEFKLGKGSPELDLAQVCLYHLLLRGAKPSVDPGSLCLLSFRPELEQVVLAPEDVSNAQAKLVDFVLAMAGRDTPVDVRAVEPRYVELGKRLVAEFRSLNIDLKLVEDPIVGPTFVRYKLAPGLGTSLKAIMAKAEDAQIRMGLEFTPVIRNVRGRIVADIARMDRETIHLRDLSREIAASPAAGLPLLVGVDLHGKLRFADLANSASPHLLVAGTTGSGKSEWMRMAIASLLLKYTADELRLVLIDPKRTAFMDFAGSPYLWNSTSLVFPDESPAEAILDELIDEMERRYRLFFDEKAKDIEQLNASGGARLFRIVLFCDEYADLVADRNRKNAIVDRIKRLGAKARAAGIHLILATQSPRREILEGVIRANLPARVCLRVSNAVESRIVLGDSGGELLLGNGDLIYSTGGEWVRLQAPLAARDLR